MREMKREKEQSDDVKDRDVNILESVNHHRVNIVAIERIDFQERELRIEFARGEVEQMKNDECEHNQAADDHVSRSPARFDVVTIPICFWTRASIFDRQKNREVNVQQDADEEENSNEPKQRTEIA